MRLPLVIGTVVVCGLSTWWLADDGVQVASAANVTALTGGAKCYYPNPVQCANALPEADCEGWCDWFDAFYGYYEPGDEEHWDWGWFGGWMCPGPTEDVEVAWLSTTIKTKDALVDGWSKDKEKDDEEECNVRYFCNCGATPSPRWGGYGYCETYGEPLVVPKGQFREVDGDRDCTPGT